METIPENYVQKLLRRVRNVNKLRRRVRIVKLVDLVGYRELGSL